LAELTVGIPEVVMLRLEALASASGKSVEELAIQGIDALAGSASSRRAILKARGTAAKTTGATYSLADLGWLDGYTGQTVDELLLFEGTDGLHSILFTLEQAIQQKLEADGRLQMTGVMWMVLAVMALSREVNNGGYDQFFRDSSRQFAPRIVGDLVRIGCPDIADIIQEALDSLDLPKLSVPAIEAAMSTPSVRQDRTLQRCNIAFYDQSVLLERLFSYVKMHQAGIQI